MGICYSMLTRPMLWIRSTTSSVSFAWALSLRKTTLHDPPKTNRRLSDNLHGILTSRGRIGMCARAIFLFSRHDHLFLVSCAYFRATSLVGYKVWHIRNFVSFSLLWACTRAFPMVEALPILLVLCDRLTRSSIMEKS